MAESKSLSGISLFSGAGGMDIGFGAAGVRPLFANELDPHAAKTYTSNPRYLDPHVLRAGDVCDHLGEISRFAGADVVFGGPPCQGFSVAGRMDPKDYRSKLIWVFMDVVCATRPKLFVMENVKALGVLSRWSDVRSGLARKAEKLGYGFSFFILNAADYGVPQARERFFFIGIHGATPKDVQARVSALLDVRRARAVTVREALAELPPFGELHNEAGSTAEIRLAKNPILRKSPYDGSLLFNGRGRPMRLDAVAKTLPAQMGGNHTPIVDQSLLENPRGFDWVADYHKRLVEGSTTPREAEHTIPASLRRLSIIEAAALQTFPRDFTLSGKGNKRYRQIGNAVPCRLARVVAESAVASLRDLAQ